MLQNIAPTLEILSRFIKTILLARAMADARALAVSRCISDIEVAAAWCCENRLYTAVVGTTLEHDV